MLLLPEATDTQDREREIDILMEEYKALREEVTQRFLSPPVLVLALSGIAALVAAVAKQEAPLWLYLVALLLFALGAVLWTSGNRRGMYVATQVFGLELRVNQLAREAGIARDPLLTWSTKMAAEREGMKGLTKFTRMLIGVYISPKAAERRRKRRTAGRDTLLPHIPDVHRTIFEEVFKTECSKAS